MPPKTLKPTDQAPQDLVDKFNFLKGEVAKLSKTTPVNQMPAGNLNTTTPFNPPPPVTSTNYKNNLASNVAINSPTADEIKQSQTQQNAPVDPKQATMDRINQIVGIQQGQSNDILKAQEDVGLAQKREALNKANTAQLRLDQAYEKEVKDIEKNAQGSLDIGVKQRLSDAEGKYLDKKADLAIDRLASQGDVDTALKIVEDKIKAKYEPLQNELDTLKQYYTTYQNDLTESQKLKLQQEFQTKSDELNFKQQKELTDYTAKIKAKYDTSSGISGINSSNPQYAGVLSTILGSGKFTKDQVNLITNSINSGEDPFTVIKNQAKNMMPSTLATDVGNFELAKGVMTDLQRNLKEFYANGGSTGIFSGNIEKTINKLGNVKDPKLVGLATQIQSNLQVYRNAVSGTAYSVQEGKDIASIFPGINKSEGLNDAIINGRLSAFDSTIDSAYKNTLGSTYDTLKQAQQQSSPSTGSDTKEWQGVTYKLSNGVWSPVGGAKTSQAVTPQAPVTPAPTSNLLGKYGNIGLNFGSFLK